MCAAPGWVSCRHCGWAGWPADWLDDESANILLFGHQTFGRITRLTCVERSHFIFTSPTSRFAALTASRSTIITKSNFAVIRRWAKFAHSTICWLIAGDGVEVLHTFSSPAKTAPLGEESLHVLHSLLLRLCRLLCRPRARSVAHLLSRLSHGAGSVVADRVVNRQVVSWRHCRPMCDVTGGNYAARRL